MFSTNMTNLNKSIMMSTVQMLPYNAPLGIAYQTVLQQFPIPLNTYNRTPVYMIYNPQTRCLEPLKTAGLTANSVPLVPQGYTAFISNEPQKLLALLNKNVQTQKLAIVRRSNSIECVSSSESVQSNDTPNKPRRKFPHRSKQIRIQAVHEEIKEWAAPLGIYVEDVEKELLRGDDTCRVHVKNFQGLNEILDVLKQIFNHEEIDLIRLATPISMKNKFQKKGFICYMKLKNESQVPIVQEIFSHYTKIFKKCDIAHPNPKDYYNMKNAQAMTENTLILKQEYIDANTLTAPNVTRMIAAAC